MRILLICLLAVLIFLQYRLWFQPGGIINMLRMRSEVTKAEAANDTLKQRNNDLQLQVQRLHQGQDAIESRARQELGMIKKGEVFYQMAQTEHKD
ncbi:MAG: cell division protein FtsB [Gammaproteobacteria bacterium]|nr:cell division protein FtsB [Gammaproteobacteria bacterium]